MGSSGVGQRTARLDRVGGSAFDLVASKLLRPVVRPGTVGRRALMERVAGGEARPIVSVVAPAGYGKTTLLSQWAEAISIYRKLGTPSRSRAVARARELGLLEG